MNLIYFFLKIKIPSRQKKKKQEFPGELNAYPEITEDMEMDPEVLPWFITVIYSDIGIHDTAKYEFARKFGIRY